jgi:murein DD-endopeptidase MepM/ murein hydrolase activator NlpD
VDYQVANRTSFLTLTLLTVIGLNTGRATAQQGPQFGLPLNCSGDAPCFVQNLVDIDRGKGILDPFCNAATFDKHKGTDIRLPNIAAMQRWGDILSIADGVVTATRGNMADRLWQTKADQKRFKGRECGNGVAINHGKINGVEYTSQFCHMARRSITVRAGDQVKRGDKIGAMGLSGATQFPHIHVSIRRNGKVVDPFTGQSPGANCHDIDTSGTLFSAAALDRLQSMRSEHLIEDGFANGPVDGTQLLLGDIQPPTRNGSLVYFTKFINLKKDDFIRLSISGPDGEFARSQTKPLDRKKSTLTSYVGRKTPPKPGFYQGTAELIRKGEIITSHKSRIIGF